MPIPLNAGAVALAAILLATPAMAQPARSLSQCLNKAQELPDFAFEEARLWEKEGGGGDARLCQAMALLFRADYAAAAERLEALLPTLTLPKATMAGLWARAALANVQAKRPERAEAAYAQAILLTPSDPDLLIDRAILRAGQQRFWEAVADLDRAVALAPRRAEAYVLRAAARRQLAQDGTAADDLARALEIDPGNVDALLARGNLRAARGDHGGAREDWLKVRQLAGDAAQGRDAAANMAALDALEKDARGR
ncbi:MAG TPA: tetratricopeptide repeat protein [Azospirillaceae bacterium]|nr:tetratricopeptide repeat protein [Azospirillaceae bacterium]